MACCLELVWGGQNSLEGFCDCSAMGVNADLWSGQEVFDSFPNRLGLSGAPLGQCI